MSNFDAADMEELVALDGGEGLATNQMLYNLARRGTEFDLLPESPARQMPGMAYCPVEQGRALGSEALGEDSATPRRLGRTGGACVGDP